LCFYYPRFARGHIAMHPIRDASLLNSPKTAPEPEHYSLPEMAALVAALDVNEYAREHAIMSLCFAGLRRSEISGAKWADINFASGVLHVRRSAWRGHISDSGKTRRAVRVVNLSADAIRDIKRQNVQ
jgi:integrase